MDGTTDRKPAANELVILVHGTYAASTSDRGDQWWQCGSRTWHQLTGNLPEDVQLAADRDVFHWSGENSERSRSKAGRQLLARLSKLEAQGRPYHLIGHSHGGSVIWHALRQATLQRQQLTALRSWSTVGTPFLKHRTRSAWHLANMVNLVLAIALLRPALFTLRKLSQLFSSAFFGLGEGIVITNEPAPALTRAVRAPLLQCVEWLGVSVETTAEGWRLGSYDPSSGQSLLEYLFLSTEGWIILGVTLLCVYIFLNLGTFFLSPVLESLRIRQEARLERKVMSTYQGRWLGLWSTDDEAINGLKTTLKLTVSFVQRMALRESVFFSDRLLWIARPYHWVLIPVYNSLLRPLLDGVVRSHIVKTALGNNRPAAEVIAVSTVPGPFENSPFENSPLETSPLETSPLDTNNELAALPDWLCKKITRAADHHASNIAPHLRCLLAEPSFASGLETFSNTITGNELVHTSYFDHSEILDLLAAHISWSQGERFGLLETDSTDPSLVAWFSNFKSQLGERVTRNRRQAPLVIPRRAA